MLPDLSDHLKSEYNYSRFKANWERSRHEKLSEHSLIKALVLSFKGQNKSAAKRNIGSKALGVEPGGEEGFLI